MVPEGSSIPLCVDQRMVDLYVIVAAFDVEFEVNHATKKDRIDMISQALAG